MRLSKASDVTSLNGVNEVLRDAERFAETQIEDSTISVVSVESCIGMDDSERNVVHVKSDSAGAKRIRIAILDSQERFVDTVPFQTTYPSFKHLMFSCFMFKYLS